MFSIGNCGRDDDCNTFILCFANNVRDKKQSLGKGEFNEKEARYLCVVFIKTSIVVSNVRGQNLHS